MPHFSSIRFGQVSTVWAASVVRVPGRVPFLDLKVDLNQADLQE